jgi:hypothetical protein
METSARCVVSKSARLRKHALECLRLAADCRQLAREIDRPAAQRHFLRMAAEWTALAEHGPEAEARGLQTLH